MLVCPGREMNVIGCWLHTRHAHRQASTQRNRVDVPLGFAVVYVCVCSHKSLHSMSTLGHMFLIYILVKVWVYIPTHISVYGHLCSLAALNRSLRWVSQKACSSSCTVCSCVGFFNILNEHDTYSIHILESDILYSATKVQYNHRGIYSILYISFKYRGGIHCEYFNV